MKNWKRMRKALLICGSSMIIAIYAGGCAYEQKESSNFFDSGNDERATAQFTHVQAASGARADATLQPYHFDKGALNSLGEQKLGLMLEDDASNDPVTIYLNVPAGDEFKAARQDAVIAYLKAAGLTETQISFKAGPNPDTTTLASVAMTALDKSAGASGGAAPSAGGSDAGMGAGSPSEGSK